MTAAGASLAELTQEAIHLARESGAEHGECTAAEGDEFSVTVRLGEVETVKEAGSRGMGIRILVGQRSGSSYTSDLTPAGIRAMVRQAVDLAAITTEDPFAGLPAAEELGMVGADLGLYSPDVARMPATDKIALAREAEQAALAVDPRINNSDGGSFSSRVSSRAFANSLGFTGSYQASSCSLSVSPVARDGDSMERDYWFTVGRSAAALEPAAEVGRKAAERVLRRLNPRKVTTQKAAVVFEPRVARSLLGHLFDAVSGDAIYRKASFLTGKLGERIAPENVTIVDDATIPALFGTSPFDDEGVPTRRTPIVEQGILRTYLHNTYTARKLGLKTTGNASRTVSGNLTVGHGNLYLERGTLTLDQMLQSARTGLYVTELMGFGANTVTGDYSRGAAGLWIENGELAYPVSEVTIAGNLKDILQGIECIGDDLEFRGSVAAPHLLIREMTISGR